MKKEIKIKGVGIHSGLTANMTVKPVKFGGIVFIRNGALAPARYDAVSASGLRNTTAGRTPNEVQTIEHLMCALYVCGIANAKIETDNAETPILDGSAAELIKTLSSLKIKDQSIYIRVKKNVVARAAEIRLPLWLRVMNWLRGVKRDGYVRLLPARGNKLEITAELRYKLPIIGAQKKTFIFDYGDFAASKKRFVKDIARARTFGTTGEWEWLKKHGMGRGANEHNVIGLGTLKDFDRLRKLGMGQSVRREDIAAKDENEVVSLTGLHYPDEFVRHKIVDIVGDLYTSGGRMIGRVDSYKGSHALNNLALRKLFADPANYEILHRQRGQTEHSGRQARQKSDS